MVGLAGTIVKDDRFSKITLDKSALFVLETGVQNGTNIDVYVDLVKNYIKGGYQLPESKTLFMNKGNDIATLHTASLEKIAIENGDIILNGPPGNNCNYAFTGIFSKEGELRYAEIDGNQHAYLFNNTKLTAKFGRKIKCEKDSCIKKADFTFGGESFTLKPGESYAPKDGPIATISLIHTLEYKKGIRSPLGNIICYVISFARESTASP